MAIELTTASPQVLASIRDALDVPGVSGSQVFSGTVYAENLIYISGNQTISGTKTFYTRPLVNGTGVLLIGEGEAGGALNNVVFTTGNQAISGTKVFVDNIGVSGTGIFNALDLNNIDNLNLSGVDITITSGNVTLTNTGSFNTLQITNKKLSSYSYNTTNFIFGDNYLNFVNSSNKITGTLPSGIISGINYYVKNLNSGILLITGSGQRTIDRFSTVNLYKNESLQLVGVNNPGYTGWVTISADNGVS